MSADRREPLEPEVEDRLRPAGLRPLRRTGATPPLSKNRTVLCRSRRGERVLVKLSDGYIGQNILREGRVRQLLQPLLDKKASSLLPDVFCFDEDAGLLALRWIPDSQTLDLRRDATGALEPSLARALGKGMGILHRATHLGLSRIGELPPLEEVDLLQCFLHLERSWYAQLSLGCLRLFSLVQSCPSAHPNILALARRRFNPSTDCVIHGDLKHANILVTGKPSSVVFLDWEFARITDPARDWGWLLGEYLLDLVDPLDEERRMTPSCFQALIQPVRAGYMQGRGAAFPAERDFEHRVTLWLGAFLLYYAYSRTCMEGSLDGHRARLVQAGLEILSEPEPWRRRLWGAA